MRKERPTSLSMIEMIIVIAILVVVAILAVPAYQDYQIRAQVNKMLTMSDTLKQAVAKDREARGNFQHIDPNSTKQTLLNLGITDPAVISKGISEVKFAKADDNFMAIVICGDINGQGTHPDDKVDIYFTGTYYSSGMKWGCQYTGNSKYVPSSCRTEYEAGIYGALRQPCADATPQPAGGNGTDPG